MPELPEVETVRRALAEHVIGRRVTGVEGEPVAMRRPLDPPNLHRALAGRTLLEPRRRGKYLLMDIAGGGSLLVHLGMSGRLLLTPAAAALAPHTHLVLALDDGRHLRLVDPRRFGLAVWLPPGAEAADPALARLGPEPLDPGLAAVLPPRLRASASAVKALLLDQRVVAGVGNIYAAEALWRAGIRPSRRGRDTAVRRLEALARAVQEVLAEAIAQGGTTIRDFAAPSGWPGYFAVHLAAYGREGLPCRRCGTLLRLTVLGGRATAWCPRCQR